jgi:hypothetical protein
MTDEHDLEEEAIGAVAMWLYDKGHLDLAAAIVSVRRVAYAKQWDDMYDAYIKTVYLEVDGATAETFTEAGRDLVLDAFNLLGGPRDERYGWINVVPARVEGDWRADLQRRLTLKPSNQARLVPARVPFLYEDKMAFRSDPELAVYRSLRRAQASMPDHETIGILPNPAMRVPGHTWEPDFLVTYKNQVGLIEVDGPHHGQRYAADKTKDSLYENAGIAYVQRITVEDAESDAVAGIIERFVGRMRDSA